MDRRLVAGLALAVVLAGAVLVSPEVVVDRVASLADDPLAFSVAVVAVYLVRPALAWPTVLCSALVGYGLGSVGLPLALAGVVLTSLPPYLATGWIADGTVSADGPLGWLAAPADRARDLGERYFAATGDARGVTAAKLAPIPADAVNCGAAAAGVSLSGFVLGTIVGELPWTVAAVLVGASAGTITSGGLGAIGLPLAIATGVGALVLLAGPAYRVFSDRGPAVE